MSVKKIEEAIKEAGTEFLFLQRYNVGAASCHVMGIWNKELDEQFLRNLRDCTGPKSEVILVTKKDVYRFRNKKRVL